MTETDTAAPASAGVAVRTTSRRRLWIFGVLGAVLLLGLGYFLGLATPTLRAPGNDSPEAGFARDMSTHHAQAVAMSMLEVENGSDPAVVELAYNIATGQQAEIGMMAVWLQDWHLLPTGDRPAMAWMPDGQTELVNGLMPGMATVAQMNQLTNSRGADSDKLFLQLMLRHHQGGIHMVEGILQVSHNSTVRALAETMLTGQRYDVQAILALMTKIGTQPLTS